MVDVIQALYVRELVLWIDAHILEGGSTFPGDHGSLGRAVQLGVIGSSVAGNQSDRERHDGCPKAAYFHPAAIHRIARRLGVGRGLHTSHSIIKPDAFVNPLLKEPV